MCFGSVVSVFRLLEVGSDGSKSCPCILSTLGIDFVNIIFSLR